MYSYGASAETGAGRGRFGVDVRDDGAFQAGRVIVSAVPLDNSWGSNIVDLPAFVPLVHEIVYYLAGARSADFNLRPGQPIRYRLEGEPAATPIIANDIPYTIRVRYPDSNRSSLDAMSNTLLNSSAGHTATLGSLATVNELPIPLAFDEASLDKYFHVVGNRSGCDVLKVNDLTAIHFGVSANGFKDQQTSLVGQSFGDFFDLRTIHEWPPEDTV